MDGPLGLLAPILVQLAFTDSRSGRTPRALVAMACVLLAAFCAVAGVGCLVAALWLLALPWVGPVATPVVCAVALILVCSTLVLIVIGMLRQRKATPMLIELLRQVDGARLIRDHKSDLLIAALVIGLVAGGPVPKPSR
jgi:hypothetical protein